MTDADLCTNNKGRFYGLLISGLAFFILGIVALENYVNMQTYEETTCIFKNKTYPTSISQTDMFVECSCGKKCSSSTACANVYVNFADDNLNAGYYRKYVDPQDKVCSYYYSNCDEGINAMEKSLQTAKSLVKDFHQNQTFKCYKQTKDDDGEYAFKDNNSDFTTIIVCCAIMCVIIMLWCAYAIYREHRKRVERKQIAEKNSSNSAEIV